MPSIQDYYEPWTYDYATLTDARRRQEHTSRSPGRTVADQRQARCRSKWSANWDDNLGGIREHAEPRPDAQEGIEDKVKFEFEQTFMFYLPRICEHCLNPSCAASCPSGAIYKRAEDGIVLVDQDRCRGWRMCVSGCPYKKVYFNHKTGKAEKCTFCFPRVEVGLPDRLLGDLRRAGCATSAWCCTTPTGCSRPRRSTDDHDLYEAQRSVFLDPDDPEVARAAEARRHPGRLDRRCPTLADPRADQQVQGRAAAAPGVPHDADGLVHPAALTCRRRRPATPAQDAEDRGNLFAAIDALRIPIEYLAELFTAGDVAPVDAVLHKLAAMRSYMRDINLGP